MNSKIDAVLREVAPLLPGEDLTQVDVISDGERSTVIRVRATSAGRSRLLVVKRYRDAGESRIRECAALSTVPSGMSAATLVAESSDPPIAVLADLGDGANVAGALLGPDPVVATYAVTRWAQSLAELHSATRDLRELFEAELSARSGDATVHPTTIRVLLEDAVRVLDGQCGALGVGVPAGAWEEMRGLADRLGKAGPSALTPADTCPDNCVLVGDELVLVDFEDAQFRHIAWDVAYLRVPWPTCWCSWAFPPAAVTAALEAYRHSAAAAFPQVRDQQFDREVETAMAGWGLIAASASLDLALAEDSGPVAEMDPDRPTPQRRARVLHQLEAAAGVAHEPVLSALAGALAAELRARWGSQLYLELAPAYRR